MSECYQMIRWDLMKRHLTCYAWTWGHLTPESRIDDSLESSFTRVGEGKLASHEYETSQNLKEGGRGRDEKEKKACPLDMIMH